LKELSEAERGFLTNFCDMDLQGAEGAVAVADGILRVSQGDTVEGVFEATMGAIGTGAILSSVYALKGAKAIDGADDFIESYADLMSPEDAKKYLEFLENGSTAGLTPEELAGIDKLDELLALEKVSSWESIGKKGGVISFKDHSTKIDSKVTVVEKQELPSFLIDTFKDGNYRTVVTNEEIIVYRSFGYNGEAGGAFATSSPAISRVQIKTDCAILPEWKNTLKYEAEIVIPKGTTVNIGRVGEQYTMSGAKLAGDADQILLPENWDLSWIKNIREVKP